MQNVQAGADQFFYYMGVLKNTAANALHFAGNSLNSAAIQMQNGLNWAYDESIFLMNQDFCTFFSHTYDYRLGAPSVYQVSATFNLKKVLIGTLGAAAMIFGANVVFNRTWDYMLSHGYQCVYVVSSQANLSFLFSQLDKNVVTFVDTLVCPVFNYVIVPIGYEYVLRGLAFEEIKHWIAPDPSSFGAKAFRVLSQGVFEVAVTTLIISIPVYGTVFIPGMVTSFAVGCALGALREYSGDLSAPLVVYGVNMAYFTLS